MPRSVELFNLGLGVLGMESLVPVRFRSSTATGHSWLSCRAELALKICLNPEAESLQSPNPKSKQIPRTFELAIAGLSWAPRLST